MSKLGTLLRIAGVLIRNPYALKKVLDVEVASEKLTHDKIYNSEYFQFVEETTARSANAIADSIFNSLHPSSLVDVGCGTGVLLECLQKKGVQVKGLEYAEAALEFCRARRLYVMKFDVRTGRLPSEFADADVAISMEVGQQLPESAADRYVGLLCQAAPVVVFSSGTPGQGDRKPLNEQPHQYWIDRFIGYQYYFDETLSQQWRADWKTLDTSPWFHKNVMVFRKQSTV